nr:unnamed protein product [Digitaria exilis]
MVRMWPWQIVAALSIACTAAVVAADSGLSHAKAASEPPGMDNSTRKSNGNSYHHIWPPMEFGWRIVVGSLIGLFGSAFGSVGGVGGGGIFLPMLALIIGFDPKSSTAMSKCMITGTCVSTVYYNLKLKHPSLDIPLIDYDLAMLIQPMLMLGISIGVIFNVVFPDWLVTALMIILFLGSSTVLSAPLYTDWVLNSLLIPVAVGVTMYEAHGLVTGKKVLSSKGSKHNALKPHQLFVYCLLGVVAGLVGGLLGVGGGFIIGPLFLELGIPPQVSSATATFSMMFSSSMSVVEFYLLHRFPVPYAFYFVAVAFIAATISQHYVRKLISSLGRASLIIFILASMIFISAISLGGVGISNIIHKIEHHKYMGFETLCKNGA